MFKKILTLILVTIIMAAIIWNLFLLLSYFDYYKVFYEIFTMKFALDNWGDLGFVYTGSMPLILVVGLILEFIIYKKSKKVWNSFIIPGYLNLIVLLSLCGWFGITIEDGLGLPVILFMSILAFSLISMVQLTFLAIINFLKRRIFNTN